MHGLTQQELDKRKNPVFQDGDFEVQHGGAFISEESGRLAQMHDLYKWQFSESEGNDAPSQGDPEVDATQSGTRELREGGRVQLDEDGAQADVVSGDGPAAKKKRPARQSIQWFIHDSPWPHRPGALPMGVAPADPRGQRTTGRKCFRCLKVTLDFPLTKLELMFYLCGAEDVRSLRLDPTQATRWTPWAAGTPTKRAGGPFRCPLAARLNEPLRLGKGIALSPVAGVVCRDPVLNTVLRRQGGPRLMDTVRRRPENRR